jgi:ribosomal-protein-alanine N-acetyltransferase
MCGANSGTRATVAAGPRVSLRRLNEADAPVTAELLSESADFHRAWVTYPTERGQVTDVLANAASYGIEIFGVERRGDGVLVGITNLCRFTGEPWLTAECGGAVGVRYQGNGYIAEAMRLLARLAVSGLGLHRVEALVQPGNARSGRMLRAAGFRAEGTARGAIRISGEWLDHVRYAITAEDLSVPEVTSHGAGEGVI